MRYWLALAVCLASIVAASPSQAWNPLGSSESKDDGKISKIPTDEEEGEFRTKFQEKQKALIQEQMSIQRECSQPTGKAVDVCNAKRNASNEKMNALMKTRMERDQQIFELKHPRSMPKPPVLPTPALTKPVVAPVTIPKSAPVTTTTTSSPVSVTTPLPVTTHKALPEQPSTINPTEIKP